MAAIAEQGDDSRLDLSHPEVDELLGSGRPVVEAYAAALAEHGAVRGLIGPREVPRLWSRHILNCAAVARLVPQECVLVDIGSGAGLPGVVLAALRPLSTVVLVESMERRTRWLQEVVDDLGLTNVTVRRGRAEELHEGVVADLVTARAVAPLPRLVPWALPFLRVGGRLLAMKGEGAAAEVEEARGEIERWGGGGVEIRSLRAVPGVGDTTVVEVVRVDGRTVAPLGPPARPARSRRR